MILIGRALFILYIFPVTNSLKGARGKAFFSRKFPPHLYLYLLTRSTAAAEEHEYYSDDDPPNVVITEKIAQAVIHKNILRNTYDV